MPRRATYNPSYDDVYRIVTTRFRGIAPSGKAFFVDKPRGGERIAIPRSLIHGADEVKVLRLKAGDEFTFRLMEWKAEELGFA